MSSTRQEIYDYIQQKQVATAHEISRLLGTTAANARHHLSILLAQDALAIIGYRTRGRGRPAALYALKQAASQNNLAVLASALLDELVNSQSPERQAKSLQRVAQHMTGAGGNPSPNPTRRIYQTVERLNHMHYQARWEARADAPRLTLGHCPYAPILEQYPVLCTLDCYLISTLTDTQAELVERLALTPQGTQECHFILRR